MSKSILTVTFCLLVTVARAQNAGAIPSDSPKDARHLNIALPELELRGTTPVMFATLVREAGLSGGVVVSNQECSQGPEFSMSVAAGTTLDKALDQVTRGGNTFGWQVQDHVANLLPVGFVPQLLQVHVHKFEWDRAAPLMEVVDRLRHLPEVSEGAQSLGLKETPFEGGMSRMCLRGDCAQMPRPEPVPEVEKDATLLSVLNRIVQAHDHAVWNYSEYRCNKNIQFSLGVMAE
jgi:hypothetical protein